VEDLNVNTEYNVTDFLKPGDQLPLYCVCNGPSEGDMVACDYSKVRICITSSVKRNGFIFIVWE
jgi:hypothetical protein